MMLAVSAKRTRIHYGQVHFCRKHGLIINKKHIDECNILNGANQKVTSYNELLGTTYLYDIPKDTLK